MRELAKTLIVIVLAILGCAAGAYAWDVEYDASNGLLPTAASPAWQSDGGTATILDGALYINSGGEGYSRESDAIGAGVPVTMETRMRVLSSAHGAWLSIGTYGGATGIGIYSDRIVTGDVLNEPLVFLADFTVFHTIRLAYDGTAKGYLWVDNQLALSLGAEPWPWTLGPPDGVRFGSHSCDSYWQYVVYSKEFLPVPEPSSLLAFGFALAWVGIGVVQRRK